jgi:hypothetical protein
VNVLAEFLGMDAQLLQWIITGIFGLLFALGATWNRRLRNQIDASEDARKIEKEESAAEIEKVRSDIRIHERTQEQSAEQFRALFKLISEQIAVGNEMAENIQADAERRYAQEQQRHDLIRAFTVEQHRTVDAVELLGTQIGKVSEIAKDTSVDAKASRALTLEVDKSVEALSEEIRQQKNSIEGLKTEVVSALEKVIRQPIANEIRDALQEAEKRILQHIDLLKKEEVKPLVITEDKAD